VRPSRSSRPAETRSREPRSSARSSPARSIRSRPSSGPSTARASSSLPRPASVPRSGPRSSAATWTGPGRRSVVQRKHANGRLSPYPKTHRSRRRVALTARAIAPSTSSRPARYAARLPRLAGRLHKPRHVADAGVVSGARGSRDREARPVLSSPHLRDRGSRRRRLHVRALPRHRDLARDDRPPLRPPRPRLRPGNPSPLEARASTATKTGRSDEGS
jgi:hypothetical protein